MRAITLLLNAWSTFTYHENLKSKIYVEDSHQIIPIGRYLQLSVREIARGTFLVFEGIGTYLSASRDPWDNAGCTWRSWPWDSSLAPCLDIHWQSLISYEIWRRIRRFTSLSQFIWKSTVRSIRHDRLLESWDRLFLGNAWDPLPNPRPIIHFYGIIVDFYSIR